MSKKTILVTGGCGYIGSHTIVELLQAGFEVVCADSLINSDEDSLCGVKAITGRTVHNIKVDLAADHATSYIIGQGIHFDGIIHFAALKSVNESVVEPLSYYSNNIKSMITALEIARHFGTEAFVFSSSCTVYGQTDQLPVYEDLPFMLTGSAYGRTKQMCEQILIDLCNSPNAKGKVISLRYFNPAGAHTSHLLGESPINPPLNLVPVITETAIGKRESLTVYGNDYDTRDGTCIRDFIHVMDLARAHVLALDSIMKGHQKNNFEAYNLGIGKGVTVLEAIYAFEKVTGVSLNYSLGPRREGDLPAMFADNRKISQHLHWQPQFNIEDIMRDAWAWEKVRSGK
ncbi:MAG: UDP-glucose 4-epimerase GalE [Saprospiraceae bacterium]